MAASTEFLKQKILLEIEKLPEHKLPEVLDLVSGRRQNQTRGLENSLPRSFHSSTLCYKRLHEP